MKKFTFIFLFVIFCGVLFCDTVIEGGAVSGIWSMFDSPYIIEGDVTISDEDVLEIQPGVEIIFSGNYGLNVSGQLIAAGTIVDSIYWTVADTTGFNDVSISEGGWGGIRFDNYCDYNEASLLDYCRMEFGKGVSELERDFSGGAVFVDSCSNVVISNCTLIHNIAVWGGAIACDNQASPTISNNTITNNKTYNFINYNGCGAGVFCNNYSSPCIEGNIIADNFAEDNGGGICSFYGSEPQINENVIRNNSTFEGGAIILGTNGMAAITENIITGNYAEFDGGGICFSGAAYCNLSDNYIADNSAFSGGALSFFKSSNVNIAENVIEHNYAQRGGGVSDTEEYNFNIMLSGNSIRYNTSDTAGGGLLWGCFGLLIDSENLNNIYCNFAKIGDDLYLPYFEETVCLDTFTVLLPTPAHVYPAHALSFEVDNSIYEQVDADLYVSPDGDNSNSGLSSGEALRTIDHAMRIIMPGHVEHTIHLAAGTYSNESNGEIFPIMGINDITLMGAGDEETILDAESVNSHFYFYHIINAVLSGFKMINANPNNISYWELMRGANELDNSIVRFENMSICNNYGGNAGGGLYISNNSYCELENVKINGNIADTRGGAIYCCTESEIKLDRCQITGNQVEYEWERAGSAICCIDSSKAVLTNCTVSDNYAAAGASISIDENSTMTMVNSICRNDSQAEIYIAQEADFDQPAAIAYSNLQGGSIGIETPQGGEFEWLEGNIDADPLFVDPEAGDYELTMDSPCIDNATDWFEWNEEVLLDLDESEYHGTAPDMGCYEYGVNGDEDDEIVTQNSKLKIQNYPNPFNPETNIVFNIPENGRAKLTVYNIKGQIVNVLADEIMTKGEKTVIWDGRDRQGRSVSSGIYMLKLDHGDKSINRKIMMIK